MSNNKELNELRIKVAVMEEREKLWEQKLEAEKAKAEAVWEKECSHYAHTLSTEYAQRYSELAEKVVENYPEMPQVNITNK